MVTLLFPSLAEKRTFDMIRILPKARYRMEHGMSSYLARRNIWMEMAKYAVVM